MKITNENFDVVVLGGGPGGYVAALRAVLRGATVCCIEEKQLGGTCLNVGCIPTKAMLHGSGMLHSLAGADKFGLRVNSPAVDGAAFMQHISATIANLRKGVEGLLKARKIQVIAGRGQLVAPDTIEVSSEEGMRRIQGKSIIIATGSRPAKPDFLPWDSPRLWTTDEATRTRELPKSIIILGGGVIGCEFATVYGELGIPTTVVEMERYLVPEMPIDASRAIAKSLKKRGVTVLTGKKLVAMNPSSDSVTAEIEGGQTIQAQRALISIGRKPNIENIGLEEIGVELADGVIAVDDRCRTNIEGIYAIGDVAERRQYAHLASRMGIVAAENATGHETADDRSVVPAGVYTHPQIATVGLSEAQANQQCESVRTSRLGLQASGLAHVQGQTDGMVKIIADSNDGRILGALIIAPHATDLIQEIALAMKHNLSVEQLADTIHPHPTLVETIAESAESWLGLPIHSLR